MDWIHRHFLLSTDLEVYQSFMRCQKKYYYWFDYCVLVVCDMQLLKPAFTILVDDKSHSFLLLIRGMHSIKDTLTAITGAVVPFHHYRHISSPISSIRDI